MVSDEYSILSSKSFLVDIIQGVIGIGSTFIGAYASIRSKVTAIGMAASVSTATLYAGVALAIFGCISMYASWIDPYRIAFQSRTGLLKIVYLYSYHGAWYKSVTSAKWSRSPTAYNPHKVFGTGQYKYNITGLGNIDS